MAHSAAPGVSARCGYLMPRLYGRERCAMSRGNLKARRAAAGYRIEQEALSQARIKGITLSSSQAAQIHKEADAYKEAAQRANELRLGSDIRFERSQTGLTDQ